MKFIADENIPNNLIKAIRRRRFSIRDLKEEKLIGTSDKNLIEIARKETRIIITFDKDFVSLAKYQKHSGIILLRYKDKSSDSVVRKFCYLLDSPIKEKFGDSFCEVFDDYIKIHKR